MIVTHILMHNSDRKLRVPSERRIINKLLLSFGYIYKFALCNSEKVVPVFVVREHSFECIWSISLSLFAASFFIVTTMRFVITRRVPSDAKLFFPVSYI